jgi:hypothetical protein
MYIHYHFRHFSNDHPNPFKTQSTWSPPLPDNPNLLSYIASVAESIQRVFKHNSYNQPNSNLNENEMSFLTNYNIHNQEYMSLNQQIREVPSSYGQLLIMKRRHSLNSMTTNIMKKYRPSQTLSSQHKPTQLPIISRISSNLETLTTKHSNTYYHPHHLAYPSFTSYQKYTSPITQGDQSYQDAIHPRTGSPHSSTHISNHYAVHFPPTSKTPIISCN